MKRGIIKRLVFVLILPVLYTACSGTKNVVRVEPDQEETKVTEIEEQKQKEFEFLFVEAIKEKVLGNTQKAVQNLAGCLEINPRSSAAMYELAGIHASNNDLTSASLLLEKAISLNPDNKWYQLLLAQIYQQSKKFNEAADIYDRLLQKDPENLEYLFMKATLLSNSKDPSEALKVYDQLEQKVGINEHISVAKQNLLIENDQADKAFAEIEKLIESDPSNPQYYGLMADLYLSEGDSVNALKYYQKIQEIDPENGFVHFSLANYYFHQGDIVRSFEETKAGFSSDQIDVQSKLQLFMMMTAQTSGQQLTPEQESELTDILLEQHPDEYLVHTLKAEGYLKRNMLPEARSELLLSLEMQKNDYMIWERVLFIDNDLQDWEGLYNHSREAIDLFPNQPQPYFLNAVACIQLQKYEEVISVTEEGMMYIVDNTKMKGQFLMLKGEAIYKMGNKTEAFRIFDESVELDPDNHIALNNYAYYLSLTGMHLDKAERMSGRVIEMFPENSTYLDTYAWVLFKKGEYSLAKFYMESAIKFDQENNPTLLEHYGDILFKLNKIGEAVSNWEKAMELGGSSDQLERKIKEKKYFEE
ncbi:MAG: tetratricopeptide repeat protein [Bacteroidales bacterium]|jgi:tetratricopeptide (TPR) repeat protein|nr:tetratricopeptide repeat protein [Bacteroidales bacterium]